MTGEAKSNSAKKNDVLIALLICAIAFLFLTPCLFWYDIAAYFGDKFGPELASTIPDTINRYRSWIVLSAIASVLSYAKLFPQESTKETTRIVKVAIFAILLDTLICIRGLQFPYCLDDTYIVFRYVNNILQFGCADFDVGRHVHAISSQVHLWMLVATSFFTGVKDLAILSQSINLALEIANFFLLFLLLRQIFNSLWLSLYGLAVHVLWVYNFLGVCHGKESSVTIFFLLLFLLAASARRPVLRSWSAALLSLCRPEGALVLLTDVAATAKHSKTLAALKNWFLPVAFVCLVYLAILIYYGTILPQGMLLKAKIYNIEPLTTVSMIVYLLSSAFFNLKLQISGLTALAALIGIYALFVSVLWRYAALRTYLAALCFITFAFCFKNALIMYFPWYCAWWVPLPPLFMVAIIQKLGKLKWKINRSLQIVIGGASLAVLPFAYTYIEVGKLTLPIQVFYWDKVSERLRVYEKAGRYLNQTAQNANLVGIGELGIIGTVYKGKMFDLQGMVTPEALELYPVPDQQKTPTCVFSLPPQFPRLYKPDRMLFLDSFGRKGLLEDPYFKENYVQEQFWPNGTFDSTGVYLYKRKTAE